MSSLELIKLYQSILRQFIGDNQYTFTLTLEYILHGDSEGEDESGEVDGELNVYEKLKELGNITGKQCDLTLTQQYEYPSFKFFEEENLVNVMILITKHANLQSTSINTFNWKNIVDNVEFVCNNDNFKKYVSLGIFLKSPNLKDYMGLDIVRGEDGLVVVSNDKSQPAYEYYTKSSRVNGSIRVSHIDNFASITDGYIATIKYDGIHHTVYITEGNKYAYVKRDFSDDGFFVNMHRDAPVSAVFSTELMDGTFYLLDLYKYKDRSTLKKPYTERLDLINMIKLPEKIFSTIDVITGEVMNGANEQLLENFFELYPTANKIQNLAQILFVPRDIRFYDYKNEIKKIGNETNEGQEYYNKMKDYLRPSDRGMQLAARFKVNPSWLYILSPAIVESIILAFFQFGAVPDYWENVKNYVELLTSRSADTLNSLRCNVINEWKALEAENFSTDGIVFYRNGALFMNAKDPQITKWKPSDTLTVDVIIEYDENDKDRSFESNIPVVPCTLKCKLYNHKTKSYDFVAYGDNQNSATKRFKVKLDNFSKTRPKCKNGNIVVSDYSITEVLIKEGGLIEPYRIRYDKADPNSCKLLSSVYHNNQPIKL